MLNQIILIGRLTKDPERRGQNSEKPVAVIRLAVDRDFKRDGDPDADFFNCSVFGNQAKFVLEYGKKGRLVSLAVCSSGSGLTSRRAKSIRLTRFPVRTLSFWTRNRRMSVRPPHRKMPQSLHRIWHRLHRYSRR